MRPYTTTPLFPSLLISSLAFSFMVAFAHAQPADSPAAGMVKVEFVQEISASGMKSLLGWNANRLFVARQNGSVDAITMNKEGKTLFTLQAKEGKGEPVLKHPESVVVGNDTIYVVDSELNRVAMFTTDGKYKASFGTKGSGTGELRSPQGIAFEDGIVYVADSGNGRIQMFGDNGVFLKTLSIDNAPENKNSKVKDLPYKLEKPTAISVDSQGQIYVLDAGGGVFSDNSMIKVYNSNGVYLRQFLKSGKPTDFSMAQDGIYVIDQENYSVQKYNWSGKLASSFGSKGEGRAQFMSMTGIAVDSKGRIFVGDSAHSTIHNFMTDVPPPSTQEPRQVAMTFVRWKETIPASVSKLAWNGKDTFYAISKEGSSIIRIRNGAAQGEIKTKDLAPIALAVDKTGALWVLDKKKSRVVKLDDAGNASISFGSSGSRTGQFDDPADIAVSSTGIIFVADTGNSRVQAFSEDGVLLNVITSSKTGKLKSPRAIALDQQDNLYILDTGRTTVSSFSAKGDALSEFGRNNNSETEGLREPQALMASFGELYVLESDRVNVFAPDGKFLRTFSAPGKENGQLDEAIAIAAKDATSFAIAELGNKRIQVFTTMHKPMPPGQVAAQGDAHVIDLRWTVNPAPYIGQYKVYRSKAETGPFIQVGTSKTNQFSDQGLPPEEKYFYRVAAESSYGLEGIAGTVVSGTPKKYIPPALKKVNVVPGPVQLKMNWEPLESRYLTGYVIYDKEDNEFHKVGETVAPEFQFEELTPSTDYTVYISARSVDGIESEKLEVHAATTVDTRSPLEISVVELHDIFSNTYKMYEQEGIGKIKLTNNTSNIQKNIKVSFVLNTFMDYPTETKIDALQPGESKELTLKAVFNNSILTLTEDTPVQVKLEASYFENRKNQVFSTIKTINVYDKHRLMWDERGRYAAFITPKDPTLINFGRSVAAEYGKIKDPAQLAAAVFDTLGALGVTYVQDPTNPYQITSGKTDTVDFIQYPRETMERKSGDCDDLVALYSAILESLGIQTRVILVPGHMFMMFSTGIPVDEDGYTMDNMYTVYEDTLWVPVETTLVGKNFATAWEVGSKAYQKGKGHDLAIMDVHTAWEKYKPASLPENTWRPAEKSKQVVDKAYPGDLMSILKISSQTKTRRYLKAIQKNPSDMDAHLQMGIILSKAGDTAEATKYFKKILDADPKNAAALNNQGNLFMLDEQYANAQKSYTEAAKADPKDPEILVNLAKSYKAAGNVDKAKEAFVKAQKMDPAIADRNKALSLELLNTLSSNPRKRQPANKGLPSKK